jgi:peptide/nickel transport system permease protein
MARNWNALAGIAIVSAFVLVGTIGPAFTPYSPLDQDLNRNYLGPSVRHPLGTDDLGRDTLSRLVHGARISLTVASASVAIGLAVGVFLGLLAGFRGGWIDMIVMRTMDVLLALPGILLAVAVVAVLGRGVGNTVAAVAVYAVPTFALLARGATLSVAHLDYVAACRASGASDLRIMLRHVLPNVLSPIVVQASVMLGTAILIASGLSFLGLGVQPPLPEWGAMLSKGRDLIRTTPVTATAPGLAITLVVTGFSLLGDALRDAMDPAGTRT